MVTPIPPQLAGMKILKKKKPKLWPSTLAISSRSLGIEDIKPSRIQTAIGMVKRQCASPTARGVSNKPNAEYS